jgi:hypothetical protein
VSSEEIGFGGQRFIGEMRQKVRCIREMTNRRGRRDHRPYVTAGGTGRGPSPGGRFGSLHRSTSE